MSEIKKETTQDAVKQLGAYKTGKLARLLDLISAEKSKAATLMTVVRNRRDILFAEEEAKRLEEERREEEEAATVPVVEAEETSPASVPEEPAPEEEASIPEEEDVAEEKTEEAPAPEVPETESVREEAPAPAKEEKKEKEAPAEKPAPEKPAKLERRIVDTANPSIKEEILPNGEVRRIFVPPTPAPKSNIKTRVFDGGYTGGRSPRPQGDRPQQGARPAFQGGGLRRDNMAANLQKAAAMPTGKPSTQKNKSANKPAGGQRFDDRGSMNKRALMKKGYIVDDSKMVMDDEDPRVRVFKSKS